MGALLLAVGGVWLLTDVRFSGQPLGFLLAFANCAFFMLYVILGHQIAQDGGAAGIDRLGAAILIALVTITPLGFSGALPAMTQPLLVLAGVGVEICSSVIPYVCDQLLISAEGTKAVVSQRHGSTTEGRLARGAAQARLGFEARGMAAKRDREGAGRERGRGD